MLNWLSKRLFSNQKSEVRGVLRHRGLRLRYDAAVTTEDNRRHWAAADGHVAQVRPCVRGTA